MENKKIKPNGIERIEFKRNKTRGENKKSRKWKTESGSRNLN